jgi:DNA-binding response OmpR family regulator
MHLVDARVLVVEDDDASREMLRATLADAGFSVRVAAHGADALLLLHREIPNLVVLGLVLPLVNGIEVLRAMRRLPHMGDVPVLVVTGSATTAHDLRSFAPVHVMRKPLELETVIATVHTFVKPRQGARSG